MVFIIVLVLFAASFYSITYAYKIVNIPVLLYHHILADGENVNFKDNESVMSLENFEAQMKYMYDFGYKTISQQEMYDFLYNKKELPEKSFMITFDDGYLSNFIYAYPILKQYEFKATIFILNCITPETSPEFNPEIFQYLSNEQIDEMRDIFEFGSHTYDLHRMQNKKADLLRVDNETFKQDLLKSLERTPTKSFAYPFGMYSSKNVNVLKSLGFKMAYTTKKGYVTNYSDPLRLKRFSVKNYTTIDEFVTFINTGK